MGMPLEPVGDATLGKSLELENGAIGPGDGISDKVGSALDAGPSVELPIGAVVIGGTLGC